MSRAGGKRNKGDGFFLKKEKKKKKKTDYPFSEPLINKNNGNSLEKKKAEYLENYHSAHNCASGKKNLNTEKSSTLSNWSSRCSQTQENSEKTSEAALGCSSHGHSPPPKRISYNVHVKMSL